MGTRGRADSHTQMGDNVAEFVRIPTFRRANRNSHDFRYGGYGRLETRPKGHLSTRFSRWMPITGPRESRQALFEITQCCG